MDHFFDLLEVVSEKLTNAKDYINSTRPMKKMYATKVWNSIRRKFYGTVTIEKIIEISESCDYDPECDYFCKHHVTYQYNGLVQEEIFDSQTILKLCQQIKHPLSSHFSLKALVRNIVLEE